MINTGLKVALVGAAEFCAWVFLTYPACLRYEKQMVHYDEWVQLIPMQNGTFTTYIPIIHPARSAMEDVCVEREKR